MMAYAVTALIVEQRKGQMNWFFGIIFYNILSKYRMAAGQLKRLSVFFNSLLFSLPNG